MNDNVRRARIIGAAEEMAVTHQPPTNPVDAVDLACACALIGSSTWSGLNPWIVPSLLDLEARQLVLDILKSGYKPPVRPL